MSATPDKNGRRVACLGVEIVDDGLNIRWRQTAPDRSLVALALDELQALHTQWPETVQCDIVIEPAESLSANLYRVSVDIDFGLVARARGEGLEAQAVALEIGAAMRAAFDKLRSQRSAEPFSVRERSIAVAA
jgi:hypothetical protein